MLTDRQISCLIFLDHRTEANTTMIGEYLINIYGDIRIKYKAANIGGAVVGRLHKMELVTYLPDLNAYRITKKGRFAIGHSEVSINQVTRRN